MTVIQSTPTTRPHDSERVDLGPLRAAAEVLIVLAWLLALGGSFGGLGFGRSSSDDHWFRSTVVGAGVAVASLIVATVLAVLGYWASAWVRLAAQSLGGTQ